MTKNKVILLITKDEDVRNRVDFMEQNGYEVEVIEIQDKFKNAWFIVSDELVECRYSMLTKMMKKMPDIKYYASWINFKMREFFNYGD